MVVDCTARILCACGDFEGAKARQRVLVTEAEGDNPEGTLSAATSHHQLALVLLDQGDLSGARAHIERSLEIKRRVLGTEEHHNIAVSLHTMARVLLAQHDLLGARDRLECALKIFRRVLETDEHDNVAACLHELANVHWAYGDLRAARACLERSLEIRRKLLGTEEHPDVAASLHQLASVLYSSGDFAAARAHLERSLAILTKVLGTEEHPSVAVMLHGLAAHLMDEGKTEEAIANWRRAIAIKARAYHTTDHYSIAETEFELGMALIELSRPEEAAIPLFHAMQVFRAQVSDHPYLSKLEALFAPTSPSDPRILAETALQARASKTPPPPAFTEDLDTLRAQGAPYDAVAAQLDAVARGAALPQIPDALPEPVRAFLAQVHDAVRALPAP